MPSEETATGDQLRAYEAPIRLLAAPASDEEAAALAAILPADDDSLHGMVWSLLHFIEAAPSWPIVSCLKPLTGWRRYLWRRCANAGLIPELEEDAER